MENKSNEISVEEKLRALYDLQIIDSRLDELRSVRGELPLEVEDLENEIGGLETRVDKFKAEVKQQKEEIKAQKLDIAQAEEMIKKYQEQQNNVRNNKEYEHLDKEIEYEKLNIELAEKKIKEFDAKNKRKNAEIIELDTKIKSLKEHLQFKKNELDSLMADTEKEENFLLEKREEFSVKIDKRLSEQYNKIRNKSANKLAVVGIERGAARGSFFNIPPQKQVEISQRKKIIIDEFSGKILVDLELVNEETEKMQEIIKFS